MVKKKKKNPHMKCSIRYNHCFDVCLRRGFKERKKIFAGGNDYNQETTFILGSLDLCEQCNYRVWALCQYSDSA